MIEQTDWIETYRSLMGMEGKVLITGGTGTLGRTILKRAYENNWPAEFTVLSRDEMKQAALRQLYPSTRFLVGDVRDLVGLEKAFVGHDTVIHAAAFKHVPSAEFNAIEVLEINTTGSLNVCIAASRVGVKRVVGISTDKAAQPVNLYGASKLAMEKVFQDFAQRSFHTKFVLTRYGNVLASTGSVIQVWREMAKDGLIQATDPEMSRFWLTPNQAVDLILVSMWIESGSILVPKLPGLYMKDMVRYLHRDVDVTYTGLRPGEKRHEILLCAEEASWAESLDGQFLLKPMWSDPVTKEQFEYTSSKPDKWLTQTDLLEMLEGVA